MENILVLGDDRRSFEGLVETLTPEGFRAHLASDRRTGMEAALDQRYSLVILDLMRPEEGDVVQNIRFRTNIPIVVLSGGPMTESESNAWKWAPTNTC